MSTGNGFANVFRLLFGIFMIAVYLGMAYLLAIDYFDMPGTTVWRVMRWTMVVVLALYGCYRCYRQVKGIDYYRTREQLEEDEE